MATQITQMCGIVYPVFAFTHCRDVVSIDFQKWGYLTGLTFTPDGKTMFVETAQPATGDPTGHCSKDHCDEHFTLCLLYVVTRR